MPARGGEPPKRLGPAGLPAGRGQAFPSMGAYLLVLPVAPLDDSCCQLLLLLQPTALQRTRKGGWSDAQPSRSAPPQQGFSPPPEQVLPRLPGPSTCCRSRHQQQALLCRNTEEGQTPNTVPRGRGTTNASLALVLSGPRTSAAEGEPWWPCPGPASRGGLVCCPAPRAPRWPETRLVLAEGRLDDLGGFVQLPLLMV